MRQKNAVGEVEPRTLVEEGFRFSVDFRISAVFPVKKSKSSSVLYCIVSIHLYSASCSAHQSEALPVRETQREESSLERTKRARCREMKGHSEERVESVD